MKHEKLRERNNPCFPRVRSHGESGQMMPWEAKCGRRGGIDVDFLD